MAKINLLGQVFECLTVLEKDINYATEKNLSTKNSYWRCRCKCGKEISVSTTNLRSGHTKSCGCLKKNKEYEDLTNQNFGKWKVIKEDTENLKRDRYWICQCECGTIKSVSGKSLKQGKSQSCGCSNQLNLTNQRFGKLIALEKVKSSGNGTIWNCICYCGNYKQVLSSYLLNGNVKSCGCLSSAGEYQINKILKQNNIIFEIQKTYEDCRFPDTNALAKFDSLSTKKKYASLCSKILNKEYQLLSKKEQTLGIGTGLVGTLFVLNYVNGLYEKSENSREMSHICELIEQVQIPHVNNILNGVSGVKELIHRIELDMELINKIDKSQEFEAFGLTNNFLIESFMLGSTGVAYNHLMNNMKNLPSVTLLEVCR